MREEPRPDELDRPDVEAARRLRREEEPGVVAQRPREHDALRLAARQCRDTLVDLLRRDREPLDQLRAPLVDRGAVDPVPAAERRGEYRVDWTNKIEDGLENPVIHSAFGYAAQLVVADPVSGAIQKVVAAHDVGRAVNPMLCIGQIEGAVHMGLGYALTEDFPADGDGRPQNMTLRSLGIFRAKDVPDIEVLLIEAPQPDAPYGIKGVGEIGLVPTAGAVAAMLHEVEGTWRNRLPMRRGDERDERDG